MKKFLPRHHGWSRLIVVIKAPIARAHSRLGIADGFLGYGSSLHPEIFCLAQLPSNGSHRRRVIFDLRLNHVPGGIFAAGIAIRDASAARPASTLKPSLKN